MYKSITLILCSLMILGFIMTGCNGPYSAKDNLESYTCQGDVDGESTVIYKETFDNSVVLEFIEDSDGSVSVTLMGNIDQASNITGNDPSALLYSSSACCIYKAIKKASTRSSGTIIVPDVLVALDEKLDNLTAVEADKEINDEIIVDENILPGLDAIDTDTISRHGDVDDNLFLNKLATIPGSLEAKYLSYYSVSVAKDAYHLFFLSFNSSSTYNATYKHWIWSSGVWLDSIVRTVSPRSYYYHYYLRSITKRYRKSNLTAGNIYAQHSIYFALKWDDTPVAHATDSYFYSYVYDRLVFVDFYATWCGPCQTFGPVFEDVSTQITTHMFVKVDVDKCPDVTDDYDVPFYPYIVALVDGDFVERYTGGYNVTDYKNWCEDIIDEYD